MSDFNSSLPVRTETAGDVQVKLVDSTLTSQAASVDANGSQKTRISDPSGNDVTSQANGAQRALDIGINVAGVQIDPRDIRLLTNSDVVKAQLQDNAGTAITLGQKVMASSVPVVIASDQSKLDVNINDASGNPFTITNPLPVSISVDGGGTEVNNYNTASAIAGGATSNHDYTVTVDKTLLLTQIEASASGKAKIEVQVETGVATGVFNSYFVQFNSTAETNMSIHLASPISVAAGVRVRVIRTNRDNQSQDLYSTISGQEI